MRGSRTFCQRGSKFEFLYYFFFKLMRGEKIKIPLLAATMNAGLVALCFFRGSRPVLLRNPIFLDFSGGGGGLAPSSGSVHDTSGKYI